MTSSRTNETERSKRRSGSMDRTPDPARVGASLFKRLSEIVESLYDIGALVEATEIYRGVTNRGFGVVVDNRGRRESYFLRKYKEGVTENEIRFEHALSNHAIRKGLSIVPDVVASREGETFVTPAGGVYAIFQYLPGEDRYSWDNPDLTDAEFVNAGRVLADYHNAVLDFDPGGLKRSEPPILELWRTLPDVLERFGQNRRAGKTFACFKEHHQGVLEVIARNPFTPADAEGMPVIAAHYDYHPGNLKWEGERIVGLFDFDWSKVDLRLFDVCMAVVFFCGCWKDDQEGKLRLGKMSLFLGAYHRRLEELGEPAPLTGEELRMLPVMMIIADLYLLRWCVVDFDAKESADDCEYSESLEYCVRLMHWLESRRTALGETAAGAMEGPVEGPVIGNR